MEEGVGNLWPMGHMRPARPCCLARESILKCKFRITCKVIDNVLAHRPTAYPAYTNFLVFHVGISVKHM